MVGWFPVATACGKATQPSDRMAHRQTGSEGVAGCQCWHAVLPEKPCRRDESSDQPSRKYSPGLQRLQTENVAQIFPIRVPAAPVQDDVEQLRAQDPGENDGDAEIPGILSLDTLFLRIANTDPQAG